MTVPSFRLISGVVISLLATAVFASDHAIAETPSGRTVSVAGVESLVEALRQAEQGDTILLADGVYRPQSLLRVSTDRLTIRSASGTRQTVILDGSDLTHGELLGLSDCSGVTIAGLTLQNVRWNALKIDSDRGGGVHSLTVRDCDFRNIWQRAIKSVRIREPEQAPRDVVVRQCRFMNDRPKTFADDPADGPDGPFGGNYVGGIDVMHARQWTIAGNEFRGIRGRSGNARAAIFMWVDSADSLIEDNLIVDCDRGIELGNSHLHPGIETHCSQVEVRDNRIARAAEGAITVTVTRDCRLLRNAINDPDNRFRRSIRIVGANPGLLVADNRIAGPPPRIEGDADDSITLRNNRHDLPASPFREPE